MKKSLFPLFAALLLSAGVASAQTTTTPSAPAGRMQREHLTPEQRATRQSQRLTQELSLNPDQATRIQQIMLSREQEMQALHGPSLPQASREQLRTQMQANRAKYDAQFKEVLTADQYTKYTQLAAQHHKGGKGMHPGAEGKLKAKNGKVKVKKTDA